MFFKKDSKCFNLNDLMYFLIIFNVFLSNDFEHMTN
jgi:hypothetical protein